MKCWMVYSTVIGGRNTVFYDGINIIITSHNL